MKPHVIAAATTTMRSEPLTSGCGLVGSGRGLGIAEQRFNRQGWIPLAEVVGDGQCLVDLPRISAGEFPVYRNPVKTKKRSNLCHRNLQPVEVLLE